MFWYIPTGRAEFDGGGSLSARYDGRLLFAEDEQDNLYGPLSFTLSDDRRCSVVSALYTPPGYGCLEKYNRVLFYLDTDSVGQEPEIVRFQVYDEATGTFTNRISLKEEDYDWLSLLYYFRFLPEAGEGEAWPEYMQWPRDMNSFHTEFLKLPQAWHFRYTDRFFTGEQYFALFEITDNQQNVYCSEPILINNPLMTPLAFSGGPQPAGDLQVDLNGYVVRSESDAGVQLFLSLTNGADVSADVVIPELIFNGSRGIMSVSGMNIPAHGAASVRIDVSEQKLMYIDRIETVSLVFGIRMDDGPDDWPYTYPEYPVTFTVENGNVSGMAEPLPVLAETECGGVRWQLLALGPASGDAIPMTLRVFNSTAEPVEWDGDAALDGIQCTVSGQTEVPAGCDTVMTVSLSQSAAVSPIFDNVTFGFKSSDYSVGVTVLDRILTRRGDVTVSSVRLLPVKDIDAVFAFLGLDSDQWTPELTLAEPVLAAEGDEEGDIPWTDLIVRNGLTVQLGRVIAGNNGLAVCLRVKNGMPEDIILKMSGNTINETTVYADDVFFSDSKLICSGLEKTFLLPMPMEEGFDENMEVETFSFTLTLNGEELSFSVSLDTPVPLGVPGGVIAEADGMTVSAVGAIGESGR